jgi:hypothetical protein
MTHILALDIGGQLTQNTDFTTGAMMEVQDFSLGHCVFFFFFFSFFSSSSSPPPPPSSSMARQPEVDPQPTLSGASKLAFLEILFSNFWLSNSFCCLFQPH